MPLFKMDNAREFLAEFVTGLLSENWEALVERQIQKNPEFKNYYRKTLQLLRRKFSQ